VLSVSSVVNSFQKAGIVPRGTLGWISEKSKDFFENRGEKQGSKMALNGFFRGKKVSIAKGGFGRNKGGF
jgi:hypothetical protein